jgi:hypothetical protein
MHASERLAKAVDIAIAKQIRVQIRITLSVYIELLLDDPRRIVPHPLLKQQVLDNTFRLNRRRNPTSGQGLDCFEPCDHVHIKSAARSWRLQAQVSMNCANTDDLHG